MDRPHLLATLTALSLLPATLSAEVAQEAYLKASNTEALPADNQIVQTLLAAAESIDLATVLPEYGEHFGDAVAVSGETLVIGAPNEHSSSGGVDGDQSDDEALYAGAAYVFVRTAGTWTQQAYLKAGHPAYGATFGRSVAISGDTIVIGARGEGGGSTGVNGDETDLSAGASGAAYVFVRSGTTWSQQAYLKASNAEAGDLFGSAVAIEGDTAVIGAPYEDGGGTGPGADPADNSASAAGAAYIFTRNGTTWTEERYLKASNPGSDDAFGSAVAISGDTIAIGAPGEASGAAGVGADQSDNSAPGAGAAYVYRKLPVGAWVLQAYLKSSNPEGDAGGINFVDPDIFGSALALDGDLLAVGAPGESSAAAGVNGDQSDNSLNSSGAAYLFSRSGTTWSQNAYLKALFPGSGDQFGTSLSLSGTTLVVGAPGEDGGSTGIDGDADNNLAASAGASYVFGNPLGPWRELHYLKPDYLHPLPPEESDMPNLNPLGDLFGDDNAVESINVQIKFGSAVAVDGTIVVAGAPQENSIAQGINGDPANEDAPDSGAAYVFDLDAQPPAPQPEISVQQPVGRNLAHQSSAVDFGLAAAGQSLVRRFAIVNEGGADLTGITIKVIGPHAADFTPSLTTPADLAPGASTTFDLAFSPTGAGLREGTLCINSNDLDENPFTIALAGIAVGLTSDQDGDGMSDLTEWKLRGMGFDWRRRQTGLVNYYYDTASAANLYTPSQVSNLYAPEPLLGPGSADGKLTLTIDWKISDDLVNFVDLPATPSGVSVTPEGDIAFEFDVPGDRAFFRLSAGE